MTITESDINLPLANKFLESVSKFPEHNAIYINERYYTYIELLNTVKSIYSKIPTDKFYNRIGLYCNDDVITYASIIAIGLYGAAYVPLNNKFPVARNKNICEQCELKLIFSSTDNEDLRDIGTEAEIVITAINEDADTEISINNADFRKSFQDYNCVLFTSGTTGEPKGVELTNSNINHFFKYQFKHYDFNPKDRFLQVYELTFDVSIFSFFMPLLTGGCCYVVPDKGLKFTNILRMLDEHKITVVSMVPTILSYIKNYLNEIKLPSLRLSIFSGDALYHSLAVLWAKAIPNGVIHNFCGPTETTIVCLRYPFDEQQSAKESVNGIVPLGRPMDGVEVIILDEENNITDKGELCVTGTQVITHYINNKNEHKFIEINNKRWYKTGDMVLRNSESNLCFMCRSDSQVKINGFRIELSEIEYAFQTFINNKTVVLSIKDENNINTLLAFVETEYLDANQIKIKLSSCLPDYMIPKEIIAVVKFPYNINGKIDRGKLLEIFNSIRC